MITQSEVYRLFERIDLTPGIMEPRIGRWHAWPAAKMQLVWHLMYEGADPTVRRDGFSVGQAAERMYNSIADVATMVRQARGPSGAAMGMICAPRMYRSSDGPARDMIFGNLLQGSGLTLPAVVFEHPLRRRVKWPRMPRAPVRLRPYHAAADMLALGLMATPQLRAAAGRLDMVLANAGFPLDANMRRSKILLALSLFEARRRIFRHIFRKFGLRALILTYAPGRTGEIAAARELKIPVLELQHGIISAHCPDYAWPGAYRAFRQNMAVPDCIGLFGPMFAREIVRSGFWDPAETPAIGAAWRETVGVPVANCTQGRLRLTFMTQATNRVAAIAFWKRVLGGTASSFDLAIKLHPEESNDSDAYQPLVNAAPSRVRIVAAEEDPIELMLRSDAVLSYNSMSLIEALGIGTPSISISGGSIPGGLANTFDLPDLKAVMPHIDTPEDLDDVLRERAGSSDTLGRWRTQSLHQGRDCFSSGFYPAATSIMNRMAGVT